MVWILHVFECTSYSLRCLMGGKFMVPYLPQSEVKLSLKYTVRGLNERISLSINKYQLPAWSRDNLPPILSHCQSIIISFPCCVNTQEAVICRGNTGLPFVWSLPMGKNYFRFQISVSILVGSSDRSLQKNYKWGQKQFFKSQI